MDELRPEWQLQFSFARENTRYVFLSYPGIYTSSVIIFVFIQISSHANQKFNEENQMHTDRLRREALACMSLPLG
jgi:hypothetical protein